MDYTPYIDRDKFYTNQPFDIDNHRFYIQIDERAKDLYPNGVDDLKPATKGSIGYDLKADLNTAQYLVIAPGERQTISTGIHVQPKSPFVAAFVYSRSGLGTKYGLVVAQGVGVIDPDYTGVIKVCLLNTSQCAVSINRGDRIAQMVFQPIVIPELIELSELTPTDRGAGGFGSTGQ